MPKSVPGSTCEASRSSEQRTEARNKSILAHGYRLISQAEYAQFARVVEDLLDRFFAVSGEDRLAWEQTFTFVGLA